MKNILTLHHSAWVSNWIAFLLFLKKKIKTVLSTEQYHPHSENVRDRGIAIYLIRIKRLQTICFTEIGHKNLAQFSINGPIIKVITPNEIVISQGKTALLYSKKEKTITYKVESNHVGYLRTRIVIHDNGVIVGKMNDSILDVVRFMEAYTAFL